jgi:hypothetical protein
LEKRCRMWHHSVIEAIWCIEWMVFNYTKRSLSRFRPRLRRLPCVLR